MSNNQIPIDPKLLEFLKQIPRAAICGFRQHNGIENALSAAQDEAAELRGQLADAREAVSLAKQYDDHRLGCSNHPYPCMDLTKLWTKLRPAMVAALAAQPAAPKGDGDE